MKTPKPRSLTRRSLLKKAGSAAGSLMILPHAPLAAQDKSPQKKLKVALVGMGGQIQGHVSRIIELGHEVLALCDVDARQIEGSRKRHGEAASKATAYEDYRVLLEKETRLDAVVIATPDHWHAPISIAAAAG